MLLVSCLVLYREMWQSLVFWSACWQVSFWARIKKSWTYLFIFLLFGDITKVKGLKALNIRNNFWESLNIGNLSAKLDRSTVSLSLGFREWQYEISMVLFDWLTSFDRPINHRLSKRKNETIGNFVCPHTNNSQHYRVSILGWVQ